MSDVQVRAITAAETRPLRHAVLRPGQSFEQTVYSRDDHPETVHLGAYEGDRLVAIASLYREARPHRPTRAAWRVRGMATDPDRQGRGLATVVLDASMAHVAAEGGGELWCNARLPAIGFYRRNGFEVDGDEFEIDGIGAHVVMTRTVEPGDGKPGDASRTDAGGVGPGQPPRAPAPPPVLPPPSSGAARGPSGSSSSHGR